MTPRISVRAKKGWRKACKSLWLGPVVLLAGCASWTRWGQKSLTYSDSLFVTMTFIEHTGDKPMQNYLAQNVHYPPVEKLREELETRIGTPLKNRGEAHITVITPIEYDQILSRRLTMAKINDIARAGSLQSRAFEPVCVGRGQLGLDGKEEQTYFIVVNAPGLIELRREIKKAYVEAGGATDDFIPENFHPHITVGFSKRDLHAEDGVIKDARSCLFPLESAKR